MKMEGVWSPEETYPGREISFSYLTGQGFISKFLLTVHNAKSCDHHPGLQEPSKQNTETHWVRSSPPSLFSMNLWLAQLGILVIT